MVEQIRRPTERLVRSPILIRDYLSGEEGFPDDDPSERVARPTEGDCISRMHRRQFSRKRERSGKFGGSRETPGGNSEGVGNRLAGIRKESGRHLAGIRKESGRHLAGNRTHRRVKAKFREVAPDYQWPRAHSFKSLVLMLERLAWWSGPGLPIVLPGGPARPRSGDASQTLASREHHPNFSRPPRLQIPPARGRIWGGREAFGKQGTQRSA